MGAVHVRVGHEDDLAVAQFGRIEVILADAAAESRDHGADFLMAQHLVVTGLLDVEDFALERQYSLEFPIPALLGSAACGLTLDQVQLAAVGVAFTAVSQLAGQAAAIERAFAAGEVACFSGSLARAGSFDGLVDDALGDGRILLEEHAQALVDEGLYGAGDIGIELALGLSFELRLGQLDADHGHQSFAHIVSGEILLDVFKQAHLLTGGVDGTGQARCENRRGGCPHRRC